MQSQPLECRICSAPLKWIGQGARPRYCPAHRTKNRARDQARAAARLARLEEQAVVDASIAQLGPVTRSAPTPPSAEWAPRLLAIGLGLDSEPVRAAALVGLEVKSPEALAELVEAARRHKDLTERKPGAIGAYLASAISLGAVRLAAAMASGEISVDRTPAALKALVQALEGVQGTTQPAYSEIRLVVRVPEGVDVETGEALATIATSSEKRPTTH